MPQFDFLTIYVEIFTALFVLISMYTLTILFVLPVFSKIEKLRYKKKKKHEMLIKNCLEETKLCLFIYNDVYCSFLKVKNPNKI